MSQTRPSAIVRAASVVETLAVADATVAELLTACMERIDGERDMVMETLDREQGGPILREYALAIGHIEDAITRANKGHYRQLGIFAITDAERTS